MSKLVNISILFPTNILIYLNYNYLVIKGPFGTLTKKIFEENSTDLFSNLNKIKINYYNTSHNKLILDLNKKNYSFNKKWYHSLLTNISKNIDHVSTGFVSILQIWGIGYKILKKKNYLYIYLGYSHVLPKILSHQINVKPFSGTYFFITSHLKQNLLLSTAKLRNLKKKDVYKGKGVRFLNEIIPLKIGKKD